MHDLDKRGPPADLAAAEPAWPAPGRAWFLVGVLLLAYACSLTDRQVLTLLIDPIRADLGISDTQISLLAGFAFAIFFSVMGLPLGWMTDHFNRRNLIIGAMILWCLMTVLCGLAPGFLGLFAARAGVAVGEAVLSPAAYSLISDYFPPTARARAMAVYAMGAAIGSSLALIVGGAVITAANAMGPVSVPFFGELAPWRQTFVYIGLPGLLIAALFLMVREPVRRGNTGAQPTAATATPMRSFFASHWRPVAHIVGGYSLFCIVSASFLIWTPAMLGRSYGWEPGRIGWVFGLIVLVVTSAGLYAGGWLADRLHARGRTDGAIRVAIYGSLLAMPFLALMPMMPDPWLGVVMLAVANFFFGVPLGLPIAALHRLSPKEIRGRITAIYFLVVNIVSMGIGVTLVALVTEYLFKDNQKLMLSLVLVGMVFLPLAATVLQLGRPPYRRAVAD